MKRKNLFLRFIALIFCAVFSFGCLFACRQLNDINTELDNKVDKETYDTLNAFVNEVDAIAKAAVSTEKFDKALNDLNASIALKADSAKLAEDIAAVKSALEGMINTNAAADAETKTALEAAVVRVTALEGTVATQAALEAAVAAINATVAANKQAAEDELAALKALINANGTNDAELLAQLNALTATVEANKAATTEAISSAKNELEGKLNTTSSALSALGEKVDTNNAAITKALNDAKAELKSKIDDVDASVGALEAVVNQNNTAIQTRVDGVVASVEALDKTVKDNKNEFLALKNQYTNDKAALDKLDADNKAAIDKLNIELAKLEDANKENADAIGAIEAELEKLDAADAANAGKIAALEAELENLKAADKENSDAIDAINAELVDLKTADANNAKAIEDLQKAYEAKVDALEKADADNKAALEKKINEEVGKLNTAITENANAVNGKIAALENSVTKITASVNTILADINTVKGSIESIQTELNGKITAIQAEYDAFVESTNTEIDNIKTLITAIETQIKTLHENSDSFAVKYQEATDELYNGEYSIDNFNAKVEKILAEDYEESKYKEFEEGVERLRFFLNRAITVDAIIGYFGELDAIIEAMPTLVESLNEMLNAYTENAPVGERKYLTANAAELDSIKAVHNKIDSVDAELEVLYNSIVKAHNNLVEAALKAEDVKANINNIATPIVYTNSEPAIVYAEDAFNAYSEAYFTDAEMTKYYGETDAAALVTNYDKLAEHRARYDVLKTAADGKVVFADLVLNYNTVRPLWSDLAAIKDEVARYEAWLAEYEIDATLDAATIANVYAGELDLLAKADAYATYMDGVYTDKGVEALVAEISAYVANTEVLYTTKDACDAFNKAREEVKVAIESATDYAADDRNYVEMFTEELINKLAEVTARMDELVSAKADIDAVNNEMVELLGVVNLNSYETIKGYRATLDQLYVDYAIVVDDANYVALATDAEANYQALIAEYNEATAAVAAAYVSVRTRLDNVEWLLKDGHEIPGLVADLKDLVRMGVTNVNLIFESGDIVVDIPKLYDDYFVAASEYKTYATKAADAAASVNAAIETLAGKNFADVKLNAEILEIYAAFVAWTDAYLAEDITAAEGNVKAAVEAIQGITIYGSVPEAPYAFVAIDNYNLLVEAYNTAVDSYKAAEKAWTAIKADMVTLHAGYDIHSYEESELNFVGVKAAYDAYVDTYYAGSIDESTQQFSELATVGDFNTDLADCYMALNNAQAAADIINGKIDGLAYITMDNADDMLVEIAAIEALIEDYKANFCDGQCNITEARFLALRKARAVAEVSSEYNVEYNAAQEDQKAILQIAYDTFVKDGMYNSASDAELESFRRVAMSKLS